MTITPDLISTKTAADLVKVHPRTILRWTEDGTITRYQIGSTIRVDKMEVLEVLAGVR